MWPLSKAKKGEKTKPAVDTSGSYEQVMSNWDWLTDPFNVTKAFQSNFSELKDSLPKIIVSIQKLRDRIALLASKAS